MYRPFIQGQSYGREIKSNQMVKQLRAAAARENIALSDETRICRFDPPFKPGFMQYNEIVIPAYL